MSKEACSAPPAGAAVCCLQGPAMTTNTRAVVGALALLAAAAAPARPQAAPAATPRPPVDLATFDQYVGRAVGDWHAPGLAIAVVKDDSLVFAKGYGVLELGKPPRVTEHTRFAIGSTTKAMTVAALAMLVDEGKLRWDDRVIDHLPDFRLYDPYVTRELTVRDLLTHRTGLPETDLFWGFGGFTVPEIMRRLRYVKPASSFRSRWEYQNVMYAVAGAVIAQASGVPWDVFLRTRIFAPLGMTETEPTGAAIAGRPNVAVPHAEVRGAMRVVPPRSVDVVAPAGSVWSSARDMSIWARFILDSGRVGTKRLITPATFREVVAPQIRVPVELYGATALSKPHVFTYALGWIVQDYRGQTVWMHTGSIDGMSAIIGLLPDRRAGVVVLANLDHVELRHALMYTVFDLYTGTGSSGRRDWSAELRELYTKAAADTTPTPRAAGTRPSLPLAAYAGTYTDSAYGNVEVTLAGRSLRVRFAGRDPTVLEHWEYDTFRTPWAGFDAPSLVRFTPDGSGRVTSVELFGVTFSRSPENDQGH